MCLLMYVGMGGLGREGQFVAVPLTVMAGVCAIAHDDSNHAAFASSPQEPMRTMFCSSCKPGIRKATLLALRHRNVIIIIAFSLAFELSF